MNPEIKTQWVAALRSGEYRQGKSVLRRKGADGQPDTYCCLGVLCDIVRPDGWGESVTSGAYGFRGDPDMPFELTGALDAAMIRETGIVGRYGELPGVGDFSNQSLADLNDDDGYSFEQIADIIEEYL